MRADQAGCSEVGDTRLPEESRSCFCTPARERRYVKKKDTVYEGVTGGEVIRASNRQLAKQMFFIFSKRVTDKEDSNKIKRSK